MIVFLDEETAYFSWVTHHREGFVLDALRRPTHKRPTLHRATCGEVRTASGKRSHWTTARHLKACSLKPGELIAWAEAEYGHPPDDCPQCRPGDAPRKQARQERVRLTKLESEIVDHVVERVAIELDRDEPHYEATVRSVAEYLDKTPRQIAPALLRLVEQGYLRIEGAPAGRKSLPGRCGVFPTAAALRTLPAFAKAPRRTLDAVFKRLDIASP